MTSSAKKLLQNLRSAATHFLVAEESRGSELMVRIADDLMKLTLSPSEQLELNSLIEQVVSAQKRHDLIGLADTLQYEIYSLVENVLKNQPNKNHI